MTASYPYAPGGAGEPLPPLPTDLDPRGKHRGSGGGRADKWHGLRLGAQVLAAAMSMLLLVTFGAYWWKFHTFSVGLHRLSIFAGSAPRPSHDIDGKDQNLVIVGNDDRQTATDAELKQLGTTRDGGSLNTDTMMIVHVPANGAKATLISLPRDSYVDIPGYGKNKLNSAYTDAYNATKGTLDQRRTAGAALLVHTIENLTGLTIDHFVQVDLLGFYRISNAIHGVVVNMCNAVHDANSGINLPKGRSAIKGTQALAFVRQRYNFPDGNGDLDRVQRQRYFLTAAFRQLASAGTILNPLKLQHVLTAVQSSIYADDNFDPIALARQMSNLDANNIVGKTIPTTFQNGTPAGDVLAVDPAKVKAFVNALIGTTDNGLTAAKAVAPSSVTVDVLNGGNTDQAAGTNAGVLRQQGFVIGTTGTAPSHSTSTLIEYSNGMQAQAKTLAAYVPGARLQPIPELKHVTLVLGEDGLSAKAVPAKPTTPPSGTASHTTPGTTPAPAQAKPAPKAIDAGCIN